MSWLTELARPEIRALRAYEHAVWEPGLVRLHANELPWRAHGDASAAGLNRYPEPHPHALTAALAHFYGVSPDMLLAGRGSDEAIDLLIRSYCRAEHDAVLICPPTFGMYAVAARIQGAAVLEVPLQRELGWSLDTLALDQALRGASRHSVKLVFVCSPNNPTGNRLDSEAILALARALDGTRAGRGRRGLRRIRARPLAGAADRRNAGPGRAAHAIQGARSGRRTLRRGDRACRGDRAAAQGDPALRHHAADVSRRCSAALQPAALAQTRARIDALTGERARVAAALQQAARGAPRVAERRQFPAGANSTMPARR